ncbi:DUF4386 domain-containing protein [Flavobacteriaceae bacterium 3-367]
MNANKKLGRIIGVLLLIVVISGAPGTLLRGLSRSLYETPDFLDQVSQNAVQMRFSVLLDMIASSLWVGISIVLYPLIKQYRHSLALAFFGLWIANIAITISGNMSHLSLLSLSEEYLGTAASDQGVLNAIGMVKIEEYFWSHFMSLMLYSSASLFLFYFFLKTRLVPRFLSVWGMVAVSGVFLACWSNIFGQSVPMYVYMHNGLHIISLIIWLLVRGFNSSSLVSAPTRAMAHGG